MHINSIEYQTTQMIEPKSWRVVSGNGRMQNIIAFNLSELPAAELNDVLQFCLVGKRNADFVSATITFSDHSGDEWKVTKMSNKRLLKRNGKVVSDDLFESSIISAMLDLDAALNPLQSASSIVQSRMIYWDDKGQISSRSTLDQLSRVSDFRSQVLRKISLVLKECESIIPAVDAEKKKTVISLIQRLRPLYFSWTELQRQKKDINLDVEEEILKPEQIENFEKEMHLLKQIEKVSLTLVDPKESPMVINQKLRAIEAKLKELSREIEMGHTSLKLSARIHWSRVLECLTRVEAYRGLVSASEKVLMDNESLVMPAVDEHVRCVTEMVIKNTDIIAELESCLSSLTLHQKKKEEYENRKPGKKITRMMKNFVNAAPLQSEDEGEPIGIEQARLAVDHALCKMGEIKTEIDVSLAVMSGSSDALHTRHEKLVDKYGKLKAHWREMSQKYQLPHDLKISEALKLMTSHGKMHDLLQLREKYRRIMRERQDKLIEIRDLIENWRYLIGSQKDTPLTNENILLSEANALLQLRPKKERQYERFKRDADRYKAMSFLLQQLTERQMSLVEKWERAFENSGLRSHPIQDGNWLRVFERVDAVRAMEAICLETEKDLSGEDILSADHIDHPINLLEIKVKDHKQKIEFMNLISKQNFDTAVIIGCGDSDFTDMLHKLGTGRYQLVPGVEKIKLETPKPTPTVKTAAAKSPEKSVAKTAGQQISEMISPASHKKMPDKSKVEEMMRIFHRD